MVTGATGHVGGNLIRALLDAGHDIKALSLDPQDPVLKGLNIKFQKVDVRNRKAMVKAFKGAKTVYHLAAVISIVGPMDGLVHAVNVGGVKNMVHAARKNNVERVVHFSSVHAFDQSPLNKPLDETRAWVGPNAYAYDRSKALGHQAVLKGVEQGLNAVIVHPSGIIGPIDYAPSRMGHVFIDIYNGKLPASIEGGFNWVDVRDVVKGAMAAEVRGRTGENYILSGHYKTITEMATLACEVTNKSGPKFTCPQWVARVGAPFAEAAAKRTGSEPLFTKESLGALRANKRMLHKKAARELGYRPRSTKQSVKDIYAWFEDNGYLD